MQKLEDQIKLQESKLVEAWLQGHWNYGHNVTIEVHADPNMSRTLKCQCGEVLGVRIIVDEDNITVKGTVVTR